MIKKISDKILLDTTQLLSYVTYNLRPTRLEDTRVQTHCNFSKDTRGGNDVEKLVMSRYFRHNTADYK